jgi:hypothetical protein
MPWESLGSTTFRREEMAVGIEPDDCFYGSPDESTASLSNSNGKAIDQPGRLVTFNPRARNKSSSSHGLTPSNSANRAVEIRSVCHC